MRQLFLALFFVLVIGPHASAEGQRPNILKSEHFVQRQI
jgi:hypothetical protein